MHPSVAAFLQNAIDMRGGNRYNKYSTFSNDVKRVRIFDKFSKFFKLFSFAEADMSQKVRQEQILKMLETRGFMTVRELMDVLQYSSATVNRDLNAMQLHGLVKRSYGGVELNKRTHLPPLVQRQFYKKKEKRRIAAEAVRQIRNGDTVFLDGSPTVQYMVPFLSEKKDLTVITNSLRIAIELGDTDFQVICLGGRISERPHVLSDEITVENAMRYCPDRMFFSVGGVTEDGRICNGGYLLYRVMIKNSAQAWFLTDRTKLVDRPDAVMCDFSALTGVISDFAFSDATKAMYPSVRFIEAEE